MRVRIFTVVLWIAIVIHVMAVDVAKTTPHWAYLKPQRPSLPQTNSSWPRNAIDFFILHRLTEQKLKPSSETAPGQLLRRVHLDLIGLPPAPEMVDQFLANPSDAAYEKIVDDLLKSTRYGERWARPWLDLARYADSNGFQADQLRDSWAYRDWVIDALNAGLPFNQFVIEQIAGDLLPSATVAQRIATGFHRTPTCNVEAGVHPEENRVNQVVDRVNTTGTVFLGTTLECAQCHDHKYDPFSMNDYYSLFAFFNNTPLEVKQEGKGVTWNFYGPKMDMPMSATQQAKLNGLNKKQAAQKIALEKMRTDLKTGQIAWEKHTRMFLENTPHWSILTIDTFSATGEPTHKLQEDGSVLVSGKNPDKSTYTIITRSGLKKITAIRLEALTDSSMHKNGPGRNRAPVTNPNFILNSFNVMTDGKPVKLVSVSSSISQKNWHINGTIDDDPKTGWGINPAFGKVAWAIFKLAKPLELAPDAQLVFTLAQEYGGSRTIGRPRISGIAGEAVGLTVPANIAAILHKTKRTKSEKSELEKYYLASNPELKKLGLRVLALDKQIKAVKPTNTLVMAELEKPRVTSVMLRGEYLNPAGKVRPNTPSILHPIKKDLPANRLGLAKWLVDPANPLIGRVTVNRWWAELMGHGIVSTQEDFGTQSEPPTHPALLDWLAVEFMERGWSMKHIHKLIVMSATYRQHSRVTPELLARDTSNKFYARAPRLRMSAEMIRDNALTISGLLSAKMHGPPIYPPQPGGIWRHVGRNAPKFSVATNEDRFRRGVYVVWRRSAPYVSFVNFDAPDRTACVVKRSRTNTPLQALTLMNDEAYVEMALAFAGRILTENKGNAEARILYAYKTAFARIPRPAETVYLKTLLLKRHAFFEKNPKAAQTLIAGVKGWKVPEGMNPGELAAWFYLTNILMNLDETITKG